MNSQKGKFQAETLWLFGICLFDLVFLCWCLQGISISYQEAKIFYYSDEIAGILARFSTKILGQTDFALRLPFLILHILNVILLYKISKFIIKRPFDRIISVLIFILLPAVMASAILVNDAAAIIFCVLLNIFFYQNQNFRLFYLSLLPLPFISSSFLPYFLALFAYGLYQKDAKLSWLSALLFGLCFYLYGFETSGKPRGYFLDTISIFAVSLSPLVFIYFVYTMYRIWVKERKELLWFVCVVPFLLCLVLSIRQRLVLDEFLPFCVLAIPLMVRTFFSSYRVRLPIFRRWYKILFVLAATTLLFGFFVLILNSQLYRLLDDPQKHFAYRYDVAKQLSEKLKQIGVDSVFTHDQRLALRLKFYGIKSSPKSPILSETSGVKNINLSIKKASVLIAKFSIEK